MKLEVGMYVRTKNGVIAKIKDIGNFIFTDKREFGKHYITKASYNLIDLIEVGDYVNGSLVSDTTGEYLRIDSESHNKHYFSKYIKSIVTKEQFSQMEYRIGDK